jgi:UDP-glucuronate 4-epimerase
MKILVTGAAGFIGFHLCSRILQEQGVTIYGLDNVNDYYDRTLKYDRLKQLGLEKKKLMADTPVLSDLYENLYFVKSSLENRETLFRLFETVRFDHVIHLAAQAGVRYSILNPHAYMASNLEGFLNMLEACRRYPVKHLVYASSSSVYGLNTNIPFSIHDGVDHPVSLYAASKKSNELMAHTYSYLYDIPTTGLRFFTVYGPWGRPDMAYFSFTEKILKDKEIQVFNHGNMMRDFTYIDDIVEGICSVNQRIPQKDPDWDREKGDPATSSAPYRVYNLGNHQPVRLSEFIETLESLIGKTAQKKYLPMQPGDVESTYADIEDSTRDFGYLPKVNIQQGLGKFVEWYRGYYAM